MNINRSTISLIKRVYKSLTPKRRQQVAALGVLMVAASFVEAISISSILPFLAALTAPEDVQTIPALRPIFEHLNINTISHLRLVFALGFIGLIIMSGIFRALVTWMQTRLSMAISIDFSVGVYEKTLYSQYSELITKNSGEILAAAQKAKDMVGYVIQPTLILTSSIFMLTALMIALVTLEPVIAISGLLGFGLLYYLAIAANRTILQENSQIYAKELVRVNRVIQDGIGGIRDIIVDQLQQTYSDLYRRTLTKMQRAAGSNFLLSQMPRFMIEMLAMIAMAMLAYVMVTVHGGVNSAIPIIGVIALAAQRILPVLQQAYAAYVSIRGGVDSALEVLDIIEAQLHVQPTFQKKKINFNNTIELKHVNFRFPNTSKPTIKNITLKIKKGSRVGLIGETGCGKSTLMDLMMGLLSPTEGEISIDDQTLDQFNISQWHRYISHVPQSIYLLDASIAENIAFGVSYDKIDMLRVMEAAEIAQLKSTIESFEGRFDSNVGERGIKLSGGQRQRIGIARAIYKKSSILFMDEGTSALDSETEGAVMAAINKMNSNLTIIYIAHRLHTLRNCDYIIELRNGGVAWAGSYDELIKKEKCL